jgi:quercetin dioxygenase-like cupin family protein
VSAIDDKGVDSVETKTNSRSMTFFQAEGAISLDEDGMMSPPVIDTAIYQTYDPRSLAEGQRVTVLFKGEGPDSFSLVHAWFGAGFRLPRHSHSADCLYYVIKGEAHMGSRVLGPGDGVFIKAEAPYTYTAGPEGIEILEFRLSTSFDMKVRDQTVESWKPIMDAAMANHDAWVAASVSA